MKTSSAKAKGRRAASGLREALLLAHPALKPDDILITPSCVNGEDLLLSPAAQALLPFAFEVKAQERLNVWDALAQSRSHVRKREHLKPVLAFTRNREDMYITVSLDDFIDLICKRVPSNAAAC